MIPVVPLIPVIPGTILLPGAILPLNTCRPSTMQAY